MTTVRERAGWAVLFGLPIGVGVGMAIARTVDTSLADPFVVVAGGTAGVLVASLVFGATLTGDRTRTSK
jgi:high-affinity Fe2+/Pb2+ permease